MIRLVNLSADVSRWCAALFARDELSPQRLAALPKLTAGGMLVLLGATLPLWTPQTVFPQVPWFALWIDAPAWLDGLCAALLVVSLFVVMLAPSDSRLERVALIATPCCWLATLAFDQHRLQPWAYQGLLLSLFAWAGRERMAACSRALVVSIYFFSALSKLDYTFLHQMGPQFFRGLATALGAPLAEWPAQTAGWPSLVFPVGELAVAVLFCFPSCRVFALGGSVLLHSGLLVVLGRFGLDHSAGVVLWNAWFLLFNLTLFSLRVRPAAQSDTDNESRVRVSTYGDKIATATVVAAVVFPLGEPWGWCDAWPAWGLYSPRNERVVLLMQENARSRLPESAQRFLEPPRDGFREARIKLDGWSLAALRVPLYPSLRFQLGVALALVDMESPPQTMRLVIGETADRWNGNRRQREIRQDELVSLRSTYYFNFRPRDNVKK